MLLEGIHLPLTTPFYPDGRLNLRKLEHNVDRYSRTPVAGLLVLGASGEGSALTDDETVDVLKTTSELAAKEKVLLACVGRDSVFATLALAEAAAAAKFDAVVVGAPSFGPELRLELVTYFQAVADRSPLPVVLSSTASARLSVDVLAELAGHPSILGVIDSEAVGERLAAILAATNHVSREVTVTTIFAAATGRMLAVTVPSGAGTFVSAESLGGGGAALAVAPPVPALKTRTKRIGFQVLGGTTETMLDAFAGGAVGAVPRFGASAPQACNEVFQAWKDGDAPLAAEKQARILAAAARMEGAGAVGAIKYGCDLNGYYGGRPRLPLLAPTIDVRGAIDLEMAGLKN
ncbi:Dihydrodipicolinate synthase/N-acetylneuraminate lyase [Granulicella rosea]|uniref:Dihydrodipicolinate synthase/N-acetylneuraminate lyase n=1 Tax=Granulicella rosea TaxID=474952 RepID=A0A239J747_9BACT|nr:dihydrodipicolinate synthase family protein [Granulicella rosea]SNT01846.1 Dihydrodipicolinate synthase/N-acetylneuraminate lyase [Granulicella rosea]